MKILEAREKVHGFTLIELSIVLVIISLIVGGVIGGKSLIRSAEIQSAITELGNIKVSVNTFKTQYDALPGDMRDAADYWPALTSNGNGDGKFDASGDDDDPRNHEGGYLWHHMGLAEIYRPLARPDNSNFSYDYGKSTPEIFKKSAAVGQNRAGLSIDRYQIGRNFIMLGRWDTPGSNAEITCPAVDTLSAMSIDKKLDDGNASLGDVLAYTGTTCGVSNRTCTTYTANYDYEQTAGTVNYDKSAPEGMCRMAFAVFGD